MSSSFDYVQYHKYVREILTTMDDMDDPNILTTIYNKTIPVLNLLGVARLSNEYFEQARESGIRISEFGLPPKMELGPANFDECVEIRPKVSDMVSIRILAHPFLGRPAWSEEQKETIKEFMSLYFNLIARIRVLKMFESRVFHDAQMPYVGNLAALMRNLINLRNDGKLSEYTIYRMNIYRFSRYNHIFGRPVGDKIIEEYVLKLKGFCGERGGLYRLGGDNFLGLIPNEMTPAVHKFFEGYRITTIDESLEMELQSRAAFYQIGSNEDSNDLILARVNNTFGKSTSKNKICYFDIKEEQLREAYSIIEGDFMQAMKDGKIVPYYQPKVDPSNNKIVGVEALCRWIKDDEVISPGVFIPILESNNQICNLDLHMLRMVCKDLINWIDQGREAVRVSINFSRNNLADKSFVSKVISILDEYGVPHDKITVELTETTMEADFDEFKRVAESLKNAGVTVSVDDFGMGYSSLNLIKDINWDVIKIDKSFVPEPNSDNYDKSLKMLYSVIHMANDIGMLSLIEGVETESQKEIVRKFDCKVIQGFYYDKPLPREEFEAKMLGTYDGPCKWHA